MTAHFKPNQIICSIAYIEYATFEMNYHQNHICSIFQTNQISSKVSTAFINKLDAILWCFACIFSLPTSYIFHNINYDYKYEKL